MFESKKSLKKEEERQEELDALFARREHLKRQYIHFYQMKKKVKGKKMEDKVECYKRSILRMLGRD